MVRNIYIVRRERYQKSSETVKRRRHKWKRQILIGGKPCALHEKAAAAVDALQGACDRRMADDSATDQPTEPLFHYTNESALYAILDSGQFWFTSIYHMDDPEELDFGFNVARNLFEETADCSKGLTRKFCLGLAEESDRKRIRELMAFYSISFGQRDDVEQWTRYADGGRGVALGLAATFFEAGPVEDPDNAKPEDMIRYGKVTYGPEDGRLRHQKLIAGALAVMEQVQRRKWLRSGEEAATFCRYLAASMYTELLWNCVTTKDSEWSRQHEMRLLVMNSLKRPRIPIVNAGVRPRVEIVQSRLKQCIIEVMVGPQAEAGALQRVHNGLAARGIPGAPVTQAKPR